MREVCRVQLGLGAHTVSRVLGAFANYPGAGIQTVTGGEELRIVIQEGDDQCRGGAPAFPCELPDWIAQWYARGEVGRSAQALALYVASGRDPDTAPMDGADARRCRLMLEWCDGRGETARVRAMFELLCEREEAWGGWREAIVGERAEPPNRPPPLCRI